MSNTFVVEVCIHFGVTDILGDLRLAGPLTPNAQTQGHAGIRRNRESQTHTERPRYQYTVSQHARCKGVLH